MVGFHGIRSKVLRRGWQETPHAAILQPRESVPVPVPCLALTSLLQGGSECDDMIIAVARCICNGPERVFQKKRMAWRGWVDEPVRGREMKRQKRLARLGPLLREIAVR